MKHTQVICLSALLLGATGIANAQWSGTNPVTTLSKAGIGTTTPIAKLEIKNTVINDPCLRIVRAIPLSSISTNTVEIIDGDPSTSPPTTPRKLFWIDNAARVGIGNLATGGANQMVVADINGLLSTQAIPGGAADNMGNCSATTNVSMNGFSVNGIGKGLHFATPVTYPASSITIGIPGVTSGPNTYGNSPYLVLNPGTTPGLGAGTVIVQGNIQAASFITSSDKNLKKNITALSDEPNSLLNLKTYKYNYREDIAGEKFDSKLHYGIMAQDIQKVYPDLVTEQGGYLRVNYVEFIPLLLNQIQQQNVKIEAQENRLAELEAKMKSLSASQATGFNDLSTAFQGSVLHQNTPNPFNKETTIRFNIANSFSNAFIGVYDLNGKQIKRIAIKESNSSIVIPANLLAPGTYVYSLVVEGNLIDSKKMVVID